MVTPFATLTTTEMMPCKTALSGLSQVSNFFVIGLNHRMTMLKTNASNLKTWCCQNLWDLISLSLMSQMDIAGASYARHIARSRVVTVAVEAMTFHLPVYIGDEVSCYCETHKLGRTSIAVHIETWVRRDRIADTLIKVTEAVYTYVSIDEDGKPQAIEA